MISDEKESTEVGIRLAWATDDAPILFANQFALQIDQGMLVLIVGQATPPIIIRETPDERVAAARELDHIEIKTLARVAFSPARAKQLRDLLDTMLTNYKQHRDQAEGEF